MNRNFEGSSPWFIRRRRRGKVQLSPCATAGWVLTGLYVLVTALSALVIVAVPRQPMGTILFTMLLIAWTILYVVIAWRNSAPEDAVQKPPRRR
ncbi:MAG: hypothetical protein ACOY45_10520 [Pseudomonadota bacterium]